MSNLVGNPEDRFYHNKAHFFCDHSLPTIESSRSVLSVADEKDEHLVLIIGSSEHAKEQCG